MITQPDLRLSPLVNFLKNVPAIDPNMGSGFFESGIWWVKFKIDIEHPLAWHVVQQLGHILNYISIQDRLPTVFTPVAPPSGNGGPNDCLSWVIESTNIDFTPALCTEWLEGRMPSPVNDLAAWEEIDEDEDEELI